MQPPIPDPHTPPQSKRALWIQFWQGCRWFVLLGLVLLVILTVLAVGLITQFLGAIPNF